MPTARILGERLREIREGLGVGVNELGRRSGLSASAISGIETGRRKEVELYTAQALADALGVSTDALSGREPFALPSPTALLSQLSAVLPEPIPDLEVVEATVSASPAEDFPVDQLIIAEPRRNAGQRRRFRVRGDCMEPDIPDGAIVVVNTQRLDPEDGEAVLARVCNRVLCKTYLHGSHGPILRCVKPGYPDVVIREHDDVSILGVIEHVFYRPPRRRAS